MFILIGLIALLGACSGGAQELPLPDEPIKITISYRPFMSFAPLFFALEEGYYEEQGLEVEFIEMPSDDAVVGLINGDIDVVGGFVTPNTLNAMNQGELIKYVADKGFVDPDSPCSVNALTVSAETMASGILDDPSNWAGMKVEADENNMEAYMFSLLAEQAGMTLDDFDFIPLPPPVELSSIIDGSIAISSGSEPWLTRAMLAGAEIWKPAKDIIPGATFAIIEFGPSILEDDPDLGKRFMVAYLKAVNQLAEGKTERNMELMVNFTGLDEDLLDQACWANFAEGARINTQSILDFQEYLFERGMLDAIVPVETFYDPAFTDYAVDIVGTAE